MVSVSSSWKAKQPQGLLRLGLVIAGYVPRNLMGLVIIASPL